MLRESRADGEGRAWDRDGRRGDREAGGHWRPGRALGLSFWDVIR